MLLKDALNDYLLDCKAGGLSKRTVEGYRMNVQQFVDHAERLGVVDLSEVDARHLRSFFAGLRDKSLSSWTVDQRWRSINTFFRWCIREGYLPANPLDGIRRPKLPKRLVPRLSLEQVRALLDVVGTTRFAARNLAMVLLMVDSGLRLGEVIGLDVEDVKLGEGYVTVIGKGDKERRVPMGKATRDAIRAWLEERPDTDTPALFLGRNGRRVTGCAVRLVLRRIRKAVGVRRLYPHLLRHTFANLYLQAGGDLRTLQQILGHADVEITAMIYTEPSLNDLQQKHAKHSPLSRLR